MYVKDGNLFTSAGVTSGVDLALALVEEDLGQGAALNVARELVVYLKRSGGQMQYSVPLQLQTQTPGDLAVIIEWILEHLSEDVSVEAIAEHMGQQKVRGISRAAFWQRWLRSPSRADIEVQMRSAVRLNDVTESFRRYTGGVSGHRLRTGVP